jgi:hypothetical protein
VSRWTGSGSGVIEGECARRTRVVSVNVLLGVNVSAVIGRSSAFAASCVNHV